MASSTAQQNFANTINTAACLIIGDEVLGGKAHQRCESCGSDHIISDAEGAKLSIIYKSNSNYVAKFCFSLGIQLKRIEVIEDDEDQIGEAVRRMSDRYDFVVTRHDDITYQSIAKAFGLKLKLYEEAYERMKKLSKSHPSQPAFSWDEDSPIKTAKLRMVELPTDETIPLEKQFLFPREDMWVPVAVANGNVHILPGIPHLFEGLLDGLKPYILPRLVDPEGKGIYRVLISTPMAESEIATYLTELAKEVEPQGVKVGSYPRWEKETNTVTLVGRDRAFLDSIKEEVAQNVKGRVVLAEGEDDDLPGDA
ncbi:hypothetical protein SLS53_000850 [Cytospora paraplurivora]|uniref:MoaB/Mog domain-containing protein n=1 Tax=Cytospora paraplurivora TaxID=2898453 RepID=A0AAN9UJ29_9PEZI